MTRLFTYSALVLRVRPSGESNREAWFLTAEEGIINATVFGGPKSRLRAHVAPFHRGKLWIYRNPVRDSRKVTDFDVVSWRPGIRELYERSAAAAAVAETALVSQGGGGNWNDALDLAEGALEALDNAGEELCVRVFVHFLWRWMELLGLRPELNVCGVCACEAPRDGLLWYSKSQGGFLCPACARLSGKTGAGGGEDLLAAGPGARLWLNAVETRDASALTRFSLDALSLRQAKTLVMAAAADALGKWPVSWGGVDGLM
jgi:DNA repair protein RecO (recombination protein O)